MIAKPPSGFANAATRLNDAARTPSGAVDSDAELITHAPTFHFEISVPGTTAPSRSKSAATYRG